MPYPVRGLLDVYEDMVEIGIPTGCQKFLNKFEWLCTNEIESLTKHCASRILRRTYGPGHAKTCLMPYANNKGADQPAHPRSLISTFVVRCLDDMYTCGIQSIKILASFCCWADWFESYLVEKDMFSYDVAHMIRSLTKQQNYQSKVYGVPFYFAHFG